MPPDEDHENSPEYQEAFSRTFAGQMQFLQRQTEELRRQIMESMRIDPRLLEQLVDETPRSVDMPRREGGVFHYRDINGNVVHGQFLAPYQRTEFPVDPAASQESTADPELVNRTRGVIPAMRHDLRPATGLCGRCNETAVARCYTIGCHLQGVKLCPKHLNEDHDGRTLPEGVPH